MGIETASDNASDNNHNNDNEQPVHDDGVEYGVIFVNSRAKIDKGTERERERERREKEKTNIKGNYLQREISMYACAST